MLALDPIFRAPNGGFMPVILLVYWSTVLESHHFEETRPSNYPGLVRFFGQSRPNRDGFKALHAKRRGCG